MTEQVNPVVVFKRDLNALIQGGELALPSNVSPDAFRNAAVVAVQDNPKILACEKTSVFKAIRTLAAAGLVPDGREAALVPFKTKEGDRWIDKCQAMPMVFGLMKMVRRSGTVSDIRSHIVYQREVDEGRFSYVVGDREELEHRPILFGDRGDPVAAYSIARLKDGTLVREFMTAQEIDVVRRASSAQRVYRKGEAPRVSDEPIGIWKEWWAEMWRKTLIRRICKRLDMSSEDLRRVMVEEDFEHMRDVTPEPSPLQRKIAAARGTPIPETPAPADEVEPDGNMQDVHDAPAAAHWTDEDPGAGFPGSAEYDAGVKAFQSGQPARSCPYDDGTGEAADWLGGWYGAKGAAE